MTRQRGTEEFDYVVVGTGSGGAVVAARLADSGASVLALEAGGTWVPENVDVAPLWFTLLGSSIDWGYQSVPQDGLGGRSTYEPRGRLPGGTSNLYIMMHVRGQPSDFDDWAYHGAAGWSSHDVWPYFQRLEHHEDQRTRAALAAGPQTVTDASQHEPHPLSQVFLDACREAKYPTNSGFNCGQLYGAGWHQLNVRDGQRRGTLHCFVEPALADGLRLRVQARATRLLLDGDRCVGVEYQGLPASEPDGAGRVLAGPGLSVAEPGLHQVRARREVIVCAGAIESPKLLMLSGIGDPDQLGEHGIRPMVPLPGVGQNFHNHVLTGVIAETTQPVAPGHQNLSEAALFLSTEDGLPAPDLQIAFVHVPFDVIVGQHHPNAVSILPGVVRPASRGWVRLASADPAVPPLVNPNYLADGSDLEKLCAGVDIARELFATAAFCGVLKGELMPGPAVADRSALREFVRSHADSYHHHAGSCRMGGDDGAVVDPQLRVRGVTGLRVADASVMPAVPSANPNAAVLMIAERCAEFLLKEDSGG